MIRLPSGQMIWSTCDLTRSQVKSGVRRLFCKHWQVTTNQSRTNILLQWQQRTYTGLELNVYVIATICFVELNNVLSIILL